MEENLLKLPAAGFGASFFLPVNPVHDEWGEGRERKNDEMTSVYNQDLKMSD